MKTSKHHYRLKTEIYIILFSRSAFLSARNPKVPISVKSVSSFNDHMQKMLTMSPIELFFLIEHNSSTSFSAVTFPRFKVSSLLIGTFRNKLLDKSDIWQPK